MLPRCGRAAHICEANYFFQIGFPAAIACFKTFKFRQSYIMRIKVVSSDKATGQLQHAGRQKQGWNPLLPDAKDRFPKEQVLLRKTNCIQFGKAGAHPQLAWESQLPLKPCPSLQPSDFKGNYDSFDFLLDFYCISFESLICFANVGCSPTPRQHF